MAKKTLTATPFWYGEWKGIARPSTWKRVFAEYVEGGVRLVYRTGTSKAIHTHLTGIMPTLAHVMFHAKDMSKREPASWRLRGELDYLYQDTVIEPPRPGYDRFKAANELQNASNPAGVAAELVRVIKAAQRDPECTGTDYVRSDAAVVATIDKLRSLCLKEDFRAHRECAEKALGGHNVNQETGRVHEDPEQRAEAAALDAVERKSR